MSWPPARDGLRMDLDLDARAGHADEDHVPLRRYEAQQRLHRDLATRAAIELHSRLASFNQTKLVGALSRLYADACDQILDFFRDLQDS